jgi:cytochrome c oxidase subunit I+III
VLIGGFVFPMMAGIYFWLPRITGRVTNPSLGVLAFCLIFVGFNVTFLVMHLTGLLGMPRRVFTYDAGLGWDIPNFVSSLGSFVMAFGFAAVLIDIVLAVWFGRRAPRNPWKADTLEWAMPSPVPSYNFASLPTVTGRRPLEDDPRLAARLAAGEGHLPAPRDGLRESLGVHMLTGRVTEIIVLPGNSALPIVTALATGCFFLAMLLGLYWLAPVPILAVVALVWLWPRRSGHNGTSARWIPAAARWSRRITRRQRHRAGGAASSRSSPTPASSCR